MFTRELDRLKPYLKEALQKDINLGILYGYYLINFPDKLPPKNWNRLEECKIMTINKLNLINNITIPTNLLILEFDHIKDSNYVYEVCRELVDKKIKCITTYLDKHNIYYILTDHNKNKTSKSPHIYVIFDDLPMVNNNTAVSFNTNIRNAFFNKINKVCNIKLNIVKLDNHFVNYNHNQMPLLFHTHFKKEHNVLQEVISEGKGKPIKLDWVIENCIRR